jgi:hypothetical protein
MGNAREFSWKAYANLAFTARFLETDLDSTDLTCFLVCYTRTGGSFGRYIPGKEPSARTDQLIVFTRIAG